jgi:predicted esterase
VKGPDLSEKPSSWANRRGAVALGIAVPAVLVGGVLFARMGGPSPANRATIEAPPALGLEAWCGSGLTAIPSGGCLAVPRELGTSVPLLLYLHGRYSPKTVDEELVRQARVARLGTAKGFAVLAMRGVQGECTQEELADTWCWPSNPRRLADAPAFVERLQSAIAAVRAGLGPGPNVLLGFSNGAYFATLIATRSLGGFDAIAIAHGGPVPPTHAEGKKPPLLLITADDDLSDGEMRQLDAELTREHWGHEMVAREGGHELPDWDVDMALRFFTRAQREHLPLVPPLQPWRPPPAPKDAGDEDVSSPQVEPVPAVEPATEPPSGTDHPSRDGEAEQPRTEANDESQKDVE